MTVAPVSTKKPRNMHCHYREGEQKCMNAVAAVCTVDNPRGLGFLCETHRHQGPCCAFRIGVQS